MASHCLLASLNSFCVTFLIVPYLRDLIACLLLFLSVCVYILRFGAMQFRYYFKILSFFLDLKSWTVYVAYLLYMEVF